MPVISSYFVLLSCSNFHSWFNLLISSSIYFTLSPPIQIGAYGKLHQPNNTWILWLRIQLRL